MLNVCRCRPGQSLGSGGSLVPRPSWGGEGLVHTVCACVNCFRKLFVYWLSSTWLRDYNGCITYHKLCDQLAAVEITSPLCRLCLGRAERPHYTALFSEKSLANNLHGRLSNLCGVPVIQADGYSNRVCRRCMDKFLSLERELAKFQELVHNSYSMLTRKRAIEFVVKEKR